MHARVVLKLKVLDLLRGQSTFKCKVKQFGITQATRTPSVGRTRDVSWILGPEICIGHHSYMEQHHQRGDSSLGWRPAIAATITITITITLTATNTTITITLTATNTITITIAAPATVRCADPQHCIHTQTQRWG